MYFMQTGSLLRVKVFISLESKIERLQNLCSGKLGKR